MDYSNQHSNPVSSYPSTTSEMTNSASTTSLTSMSTTSRKRKSAESDEGCGLEAGKSLEVLNDILNSESVESTQQYNKSKRAKLTKIEKLDYAEPTSESASSSAYNCSSCLLGFSSLAKYLMHKHKVHSNGSSTQCPVCRKSINS